MNTKQFVRLLNQGGYYQPSDTKFNIGDIWAWAIQKRVKAAANGNKWCAPSVNSTHHSGIKEVDFSLI